jgi:cyanophycin synthetase
MKDFSVSKFAFFSGPNYYLDRKAMVFNLFLDPEEPGIDRYRETVARELPALTTEPGDRVADLFAKTLLQVLRMDIDLHLERWDISRDGAQYVIAAEYHDRRVAEDAVYLVRDWFRALGRKDAFDFQSVFAELQEACDRTLYGGPTVYSLVEGGLKRDIPVNFLWEENQFQWGYGIKQLRGRSTTLHTDGIKDTEFTMYKDRVKEFLLNCGFPTPDGGNCLTGRRVRSEAERLSFPIVVKPIAGHKGKGVTTGITS